MSRASTERTKERNRERARKWYQKNKERATAAKREYYQNNKERLKERNRAWVKAHPEWARGYGKKYRDSHVTERRERFKKNNLKSKYGLSIQEYDAMRSSQGGKCAICGRKADPPHVDHDHKTRAVRGLLCFHCNAGLGHYGDSPALLRKAAEYLERDR